MYNYLKNHKCFDIQSNLSFAKYQIFKFKSTPPFKLWTGGNTFKILLL
jgi:hypothetical protein